MVTTRKRQAMSLPDLDDPGADEFQPQGKQTRTGPAPAPPYKPGAASRVAKRRPPPSASRRLKTTRTFPVMLSTSSVSSSSVSGGDDDEDAAAYETSSTTDGDAIGQSGRGPRHSPLWGTLVCAARYAATLTAVLVLTAACVVVRDRAESAAAVPRAQAWWRHATDAAVRAAVEARPLLAAAEVRWRAMAEATAAVLSASVDAIKHGRWLGEGS